MKTRHRIVNGDSRDLSELDSASVELVVTSPPYPMIEMWDGMYRVLRTDIGDALDKGKGYLACELMHNELEKVWRELSRVVVSGGLVCVVVGNATRSVNGSFNVYMNTRRIIDRMRTLGFDSYPSIIWHKPTNSPAKFMGSGMIPTSQYPTQEHEHILIFRNGHDNRQFPPKDENRYESAYFYDERNRWFSDVWRDVVGESQSLPSGSNRERSGAYPFEIPYRLINMFSVKGDTVLDPFWGVGTTTLAAMVAERNSIGYEIDEYFIDSFDPSIAPELSNSVVNSRIARQKSRVKGEYTAENYDFDVKTKQERRILLRKVQAVEEVDGNYEVSYR